MIVLAARAVREILITVVVAAVVVGLPTSALVVHLLTVVGATDSLTLAVTAEIIPTAKPEAKAVVAVVAAAAVTAPALAALAVFALYGTHSI